MAIEGREDNRNEGARVSTLELFFDLVFVFTLTQLTGILAKKRTCAVSDGSLSFSL